MVDGQGCFLAPPILAGSSCDAGPEGQRKNRNQWCFVTCHLELPDPAGKGKGKGKGGLGEIRVLDSGGKGDAEEEEEEDDSGSSAAWWKERKRARLEISSSGRAGRVRSCGKKREGLLLRSGSGGEKVLGDCAGQRAGDAREAEDAGEGLSSDDSYLPGLQDDIALQFFASASRSDYGALASLNRRFRSLLGTGELYRLRRQNGIVEHWIYLVCDLMGWEAFDPRRHRWMRLPGMPSDECFNSADKESLAVGTELLVFGREIGGFVICRYSLLTHSWSRGPGMNLPRCLFGSSSLGEIAIVAGGSNQDGVVLRSAELYNSESGTWETLPDMHTPRRLCSGFFLDGKFYVIGGMASNTESLTCGEEFNLETRTWRCIRNMFPGGNGAAQAPPLVAVVNNQLYAVEHSRNEVKKYNKQTNTWSVLGRLPPRVESTNGWGLAFKACGNDLIVIGGQRGPEGESIELNSWRPTGVVGAPVWNLLAVKERAGVFVYNCAVMGC